MNNSERILRQIERLLDQADDAMVRHDWATVRARAKSVLAFDPDNRDARLYLEAAERGISGAEDLVEASRQSVPAPAPSGPPASDTEGEDQTSTTAGHYGAAFPDADLDSIKVHLSLVGTGAIMGQANQRNLMTRFDINAARYSLMRALYFAVDHRLPQSELARGMNVSSPNVTQLIDGLERDNYVERAVSEVDRRVTYAQLTPDGLQKCVVMVAATAVFMVESCSSLSTVEKRTLVELLGRLRIDIRRRFLQTD